MTTGIILLRPKDITQLTGTGTITLSNDRVAGYINTDGANSVAVTLREDDASGNVLFMWNSPLAVSIWPIQSGSKTIYYDVSGTGGFLLLYPVLVGWKGT